MSESELTPVQALGVALSVAAPTMLMADAQDAAPAMLAHLEAMGYRLSESERPPVDPPAAPRPEGLDARLFDLLDKSLTRYLTDLGVKDKETAQAVLRGVASSMAARLSDTGDTES